MKNFAQEMEKRGIYDTAQLCYVMLKKNDSCHKKITRNNELIMCLMQENQDLLRIMRKGQVALDVIDEIVMSMDENSN